MNTISIPALYYSYQHKLPIDLSQVVRLEGTGNYTTFILTDGARHLSSKSLSVYAPNLPPVFVRVHKGYIINRRFVVGFDKTRRCVLMMDGSAVKIARRRWRDLIKNKTVEPNYYYNPSSINQNEKTLYPNFFPIIYNCHCAKSE